MNYFELKHNFEDNYKWRWTCTTQASEKTNGLAIARFLDEKNRTVEVYFNPDNLEVAFFKYE